MNRIDKIFLISDDEEDRALNQFRNILKQGDEQIELIYSRSNIDDLKNNLRRDYFAIFIDYDYLDMDVNELVSIIRGYLQSLPLIDVMSYDESVFNRKKIPHVSFLDKNNEDEWIYSELVNFIKVMKFSKSVNDVSHLPGNYVINHVMEIKLQRNADFVVMYLDIDKFKAFYDYYGIYRSGQVIKYLSDLVIDLIEEYGEPEDFVGHVGGDDFVIICNDYKRAKIIGEKIIEGFDANISNFYDESDLENGYIEVLNRNSVMEKFPVVTLSIVSISNEVKDYSNTDEIYRDMMIVKKEAKQTMGSILVHNT